MPVPALPLQFTECLNARRFSTLVSDIMFAFEQTKNLRIAVLLIPALY